MLFLSEGWDFCLRAVKFEFTEAILAGSYCLCYLGTKFEIDVYIGVDSLHG